MAYKLLILWLGLYTDICAQADESIIEIEEIIESEEPVNTEILRKVSEDALAEILALIEEHDIPAPEVKEPSKFMILVRRIGISLAYKYYALKKWFFE